MKFIKAFIQHDLFRYLVAGVITTAFYFVVRIGLFHLTHQSVLTTIVANALSILVAFVLNDRWVFNQPAKGWESRLVKFFVARLSSMGLDVLLSFIFIQSFPGIIGQFVNNDLDKVNAIVALIGQVLIMVTNYFLSKFLIFKEKK